MQGDDIYGQADYQVYCDGAVMSHDAPYAGALGRPPTSCDYCDAEGVPVKMASSVETGSGGGYTTYACEDCQERGPQAAGRGLYGATPGRWPGGGGRASRVT